MKVAKILIILIIISILIIIFNIGSENPVCYHIIAELDIYGNQTYNKTIVDC